MRITLIHLSDIHFKEDDAANPILGRVKEIASCCVAHLREVGTRAALLCVTGDIAGTGISAEYIIAQRFLNQLTSLLKEAAIEFEILLVPGNHDCNFRSNDAVRDMVLDKTSGDTPPPEVAATCTSIQAEFFSFTRKHHQWNEASRKRLFDIRSISIGGMKVVAYLLNSAWVSRIKEVQGALFFPAEALRLGRSTESHDLAIAMMHHPFGWYESANSKALKRSLEDISDLILTGHEHDGDTFVKEKKGGQVTYLEGAVLQESRSREKSGFILVDIDSSSCRIVSATWDSSAQIYRRKPMDERPFVVNRSRMKGLLRFSQAHERWIEDLGLSLVHPRKAKLVLEDIFVCPDIEEITYKNASEDSRVLRRGDQSMEWLVTRKKAFIAGAERVGKTALIKMLISRLYRMALVPVLIKDALELSEPIIGKNRRALASIIETSFAQQYENADPEVYAQSAKEKKAIIIEDLNRLDHIHGLDWLIEALEDSNEYVFITGWPALRMSVLQDAGRASKLLSLAQCDILELGHQRRYELVYKWHSINEASLAASQVLTKKTMSALKQISSALGRDFLPSHPVFILILLQQIEANNSVDVSSGSYGYLYSVLVIKNLGLISNKNSEIDTYQAYLRSLHTCCSRARAQA